MTWSKLNGIAAADVGEFNTVGIADILKINGIESPSAGYTIDNSCVFNGSDEAMVWTPGAGGSPQKGTFSCWYKQDVIDTAQGNHIFGGFVDNGHGNRIGFSVASQLDYTMSATPDDWVSISTATFKDTTNWHHICIAIDTTQATATDRFTVWTDGVELTGWAQRQDADQNEIINFFKNGAIQSIGNNQFSGGFAYFQGHLAECVGIDGTAYDVSDFYDNGDPVDPSGLTFGTNGFWLDFENSGDLGNDVSGLSNDFTPQNMTSGNQSTDTPTNPA